jgi:DNA-binding response OmpR family regulator
LDGFGFVRLVRRAKDGPELYVPIIMLTGHTELDHVVQARDAGVTEFLAKPLTADALRSRIEEVIEDARRFARSPTCFGPDRRREVLPCKKPERRKRDP